jgi:hypothetical protein
MGGIHSWSDLKAKIPLEHREEIDAKVKAIVSSMRDPLLRPKPGDIWKVKDQYIMVDYVDEQENALGYVSAIDNCISEWHTIKEFANAMVANNAQLELYAEDTKLSRHLNEQSAMVFLKGAVSVLEQS